MLHRSHSRSAEEDERLLAETLSVFSAENAEAQAVSGIALRSVIRQGGPVSVEAIARDIDDADVSACVSPEPLSESHIRDMLSRAAALPVEGETIGVDAVTLRTVHDALERRVRVLRMLRSERRRPASERPRSADALREAMRDALVCCAENTEVSMKGRGVLLTDEDRVCADVLLHLSLGARERFLGILALACAGKRIPQASLRESLRLFGSDASRPLEAHVELATELGLVARRARTVSLTDMFDEVVAHGIASARETIMGLRRTFGVGPQAPARVASVKRVATASCDSPFTAVTGGIAQAACAVETGADSLRSGYDPARENPTLFQLWTDKYGETEAAAMLRRAAGVERASAMRDEGAPRDTHGTKVRYWTKETLPDRPESPIFVSPGREFYDSTWEYFEGVRGLNAFGGNAAMTPTHVPETSAPPRYAQPSDLEITKNAQRKQRCGHPSLNGRKTNAFPGTSEKLEELARRNAEGVPLWMDDDRRFFDDQD